MRQVFKRIFGWSVSNANSSRSYDPVTADLAQTKQALANLLNDLLSTTLIMSPVPVAPSVVSAPSISGSAIVGQALTCTPGVYAGSPSPTVARVWKRGSTTISGATGTTYVVQSADLGQSITVVESPTNSVGTITSTSNAIGPILAGAPVTLSVWLGQSNSEGWANDFTATTAVTKGNGYQYFGGQLFPLGRTLFGRNKGGPQAAWVESWVNAGGLPCIVVEGAFGGSSMIAAAAGSGGTWDLASSGNHYETSAKAMIDGAIAAATAAGFFVKNLHVIWVQGEQDAHGYSPPNVTDAIYRTKLNALIDRIQSDYSTLINGFFISELGTSTQDFAHPPATDDGNNPEVSDYVLIRAAQAQVAADKAIAHLVFTKAKTFARLSMMNDDGANASEHYSQAGYNLLGSEGATNAVAAIGGLSENPTPARSKFDAIATAKPTVSGWKRVVFKSTRVGAIAPQVYSTPEVPDKHFWIDCTGDNQPVSAQAISWLFSTTGQKEFVLYVSDVTGAATIVSGGNLQLVDCDPDAGVKVGTYNLGDTNDIVDVDAVLIGIDASGLTSGAVYVSQTPAKVPGATGQTAKANLISRGCTVLTN
jgi:hypothetical protein